MPNKNKLLINVSHVILVFKNKSEVMHRSWETLNYSNIYSWEKPSSSNSNRGAWSTEVVQADLLGKNFISLVTRWKAAYKLPR